MKTKFIICLFLFFFVSLSSNAQNADFNMTGGITVDAFVPTFTDNTALTTASWTTLTSSPHAVSRSCCTFVTVNDTGYVYQFGGGSAALLTNVAKYNVRTSAWTNSVSVIPFQMSAATSINVKDSLIYIFGGNTPTLGKTLKYNVITNTWTTLADMSSSPCTDALVLKYRDSLIYVIGGGDGIFGANTFNAVRLYNRNTNTWSTPGANYPLNCAMMGGGIYGDTIISAAGWTGTVGTAN